MEEDRNDCVLGSKWSMLTNFRILKSWPTGRPDEGRKAKIKRVRSVQGERWQLYATYCPFC